MTGGPDIITVTITDGQIGQRFDRAIADAVPSLSRERIQTLLADGQISVAGISATPRASARIAEPLTLTIIVPPARDATATAQDMPLSITYEDDDLIVVDKPVGMVVHPANGNPDGTLVNALLHHCRGQLSGIGGVARPGIVHRIDKDTSGLIVVAKNDRAHAGLAEQFFHHSIERIYHCIVAGVPVPPTGTVSENLARSTRDRTKIAVVPAPAGKRAVTHFRMIAPLDRAALVECRLETGRTHQVRVHMAHRGHPLLGDAAYGRQGPHSAMLRDIGFRRQALHAARLGFIHPVTGKALSFDSAMPADMQDLFTRLQLAPTRR